MEDRRVECPFEPSDHTFVAGAVNRVQTAIGGISARVAGLPETKKRDLESKLDMTLED